VDAIKDFEQKKIDKAIEKLIIAISPCYYSNVKFIDAYNLLIECVFRKDFEGFSGKLLSKIEDFLRWYKRRLTEGFFVIREIYIKNKILSETNIENELLTIEKELKETKNRYEAIKKKVVLKESIAEFEELVSLIQGLREAIEERIIHEGQIEDIIFETPEFIALINNKYIKEIIKSGIKKLEDLKVNLDFMQKVSEVNFMMFNIIRKGIDFDKNNTIAAIRAYLYRRLKKEAQSLYKAGKPLKEELGYKLDKIKDTSRGKRKSPSRSKIDFDEDEQ